MTSSPITNPTTLAPNNWGFAVTSPNSTISAVSPINNFDTPTTYALNDGTAKYANLPTTDTQIYQTNQTTTQQDEFDFYYAVAINTSQEAGTYANRITYSVIGADMPEPIIPMQTFTTAQCAALDVYTNTGDDSKLRTLTDIRNNQKYLVGKLADGNCWMLNNLKISLLDVADNPALTNSGIDTAVLAAQTAPANADDGTYYDAPRYYDPTCNADGGDPTNNGYTCDDSDGDLTSERFYGYLYNWCAAKGGTPESCVSSSSYPTPTAIDICPANWHMPTGDSSGEFAVLNGSLYNNTPSPADVTSNALHAVNFQFSGAFRGVFAGIRNGSHWLNQDDVGFLWSASNRSGYSSAHYLIIYINSVDPDSYDDRMLGMPVRCLIGS
jgi:uncharacterized protein (TIGR02145 family)